ncbi:Wdr60 [Acrasis kona]|uniref:Wdr60 n=1 Tax=Acrasis kona TaxID=1008807 RepID=A0AAW2ZDL8_9EUKA
MINENHLCRVVSVLSSGYNKSYKSKSLSEIDSLQLTSLDEQGTIMFWSIAILSQDTISETDFGLRVGGKVRLIPSGRKNAFGISNTIGRAVDQDSSSMLGDMEQDVALLSCSRAFCLEIEPTSTSQFLIGIDSGKVMREARFNKVTPRIYGYRSRAVKDPTAPLEPLSTCVNCVNYSMFLPEYFVAGYNDGTISFFQQGYPAPLFKLITRNRSSIVDVRWSVTRPCIIFAIDENSCFYIIDMLSDKANKLQEQDVSITLSQGSKTNVSTRILSLPQAQQQQRLYKMLSSNKRKNTNITSNNPSFGIGYEDGRFDLHILNDELNVTNPKQEISQMEAVLKGLFIKNHVDV